MKKYIFLCLISILFINTAFHVSAEKPEVSHQFTLVKNEDLTELEKLFVEHAKENQGVYQYGSLYVISLGAKPNPGYGLEFEKQEQTFEQLKLYVKKTFPEENMVYPNVISYPYVVGRFNLPPYTTFSVLETESNKPLFNKGKALLNFQDKRLIMDVRKEWTITFPNSISLNYQDIFVERLGEKNEKHPVQIMRDNKNNKIVKVRPIEPYKIGETYILHIENKKNRKKTIVPFEVKEQMEFLYDFSEGLHGWTGDFSDLPIQYNKEDFALEFVHGAIPLKGEKLKKGLLLSGMNRSDDLFMYAKKRFAREDGLLPNQTYLLSMELDFYTNVEPGLIGVGGSPGESVYVKAGASTREPKSIPLNSDLRMNIDKGEQASSGKDAIVIGNVAKEQGTQQQYEVKKLKMTEPIKVKTNADGELWAIFGTDSGFEGMTSLYYSKVKISLEKYNN